MSKVSKNTKAIVWATIIAALIGVIGGLLREGCNRSGKLQEIPEMEKNLR